MLYDVHNRQPATLNPAVFLLDRAATQVRRERLELPILVEASWSL
jgi:hypothetical protein